MEVIVYILQWRFELIFQIYFLEKEGRRRICKRKMVPGKGCLTFSPPKKRFPLNLFTLSFSPLVLKRGRLELCLAGLMWGGREMTSLNNFSCLLHSRGAFIRIYMQVIVGADPENRQFYCPENLDMVELQAIYSLDQLPELF